MGEGGEEGEEGRLTRCPPQHSHLISFKWLHPAHGSPQGAWVVESSSVVGTSALAAAIGDSAARATRLGEIFILCVG